MLTRSQMFQLMTNSSAVFKQIQHTTTRNRHSCNHFCLILRNVSKTLIPHATAICHILLGGTRTTISIPFRKFRAKSCSPLCSPQSPLFVDVTQQIGNPSSGPALRPSVLWLGIRISLLSHGLISVNKHAVKAAGRANKVNGSSAMFSPAYVEDSEHCTKHQVPCECTLNLFQPLQMSMFI